MAHYTGLADVSLFHGGAATAGDVLTVPTSMTSTGPSSVAVSPLAVPGIVDSNASSSASERGSPDSGLIPGLTFDKPKGSRKRTHDSSASSNGGNDPDAADLALKRQRNNIAAKKYRQKRIDRITELEEEVDEVKRERDELRIKLARQEAETAALREMLKMGVSPKATGSD